MINSKAVLYMLAETKYSMMSFVIITKANRAIVIDGDGRKICQVLSNT